MPMLGLWPTKLSHLDAGSIQKGAKHLSSWFQRLVFVHRLVVAWVATG